MENSKRLKWLVKRMLRETKERANEEWSAKSSENFKEKKILWKRVNEVTKSEIQRLLSVRN